MAAARAATKDAFKAGQVEFGAKIAPRSEVSNETRMNY